MTTETDQKRNEKLATWVQCFKIDAREGFANNRKIIFTSELYSPDFISSLDPCFKHLVPKAIDRIMYEQECSSDVAYGILFKKWLQELELDMERPALTLCKAIEKLIDIGKEEA